MVSYGAAPAVIEKRHFYLDKGNAWRHGKIRGFTAMDFSRVMGAIDQFWEILSQGWLSAKTPEAIPVVPINQEHGADEKAAQGGEV